ncbi:hypothetical protein [Streptomyces sp. NPDC058476]|uniref:hypothetical protein n=1 Tax=Streptomyces sp. NPDC058476 TaxID=3346519 RepID=UPI003666C4D5
MQTDQPAQRSAGALFGSLPRVTWHQDGDWRRQMARAFDDLAADCSLGAEVEPRSTGEEMALHLGTARAQDLTRNRPRLVRDTVLVCPKTGRISTGTPVPTSSSRTTTC